MSNFSGYKTTAFKETQKFFVLDPATGSPSFVQGSDLVDYLRPSLNSVDVETTTDAAVNADYDVGKVIQTTGESSPGDGNPGLFLVVAAGTGGIPMLNGNELLVLEGANTALGISYDNTASGYSATNVQEAIDNFAVNTAGNGSDLIAHTGTSDTVTEALDKRVIRKTSVAEIEALTGVADYQISLSGLRSGIFEFDSSDLSAEVSADPLQGIYIAPSSDATGGSGAWVRSGVRFATPEMFGIEPDVVIDDASGTVTGTDCSVAAEFAMGQGIPFFMYGNGGYYFDELSMPSGGMLITFGDAYIAGPLNKAAVRTGDQTGSEIEEIHIDVKSKQVKIFNDSSVATSKGFPSGALLAGNEATTSVSVENVKRSLIRIRHEDGRYAFTSYHGFDGSTTPPAPAAGFENDTIELDVVATGEVWTAANVIVKNLVSTKVSFIGTTDNDGIKSAVGFAKLCSGHIDNVYVYGGFNGCIFEHEIDGLSVGSIELSKQRSKNLVISKGDQSAGPINLNIGLVSINNGTTGTERPSNAVEVFDSSATIGTLRVSEASSYGVQLTTNSELRVDNAEFVNCDSASVFNNACTFIAGTVAGEGTVSVLATGGASYTQIEHLRSNGSVTGDLINGGSNSVYNIGKITGQADLGISISTGAAGSVFGFIDASDTVNGFSTATTLSSLKLTRVIDETGRVIDYLGGGVLRTTGSGSPEGVITANPGSEFNRTDPISNATVKYFKVTGSGTNTGWVAIGST